jgi:hypothetical protein
MRAYYDPEDDTCEKTDRHERLMDLADHLRDEAKDREMEESYNNFAASSGAAEKPPVAMLPADADTTLWGVGVSDAAGGYSFTDTADSIRPPTEAENSAYRAAGIHYAQVARALLATCFHLMTGREINACQIATGDFDTDEGFNAYLIELLSIQFSRKISEHINHNASLLP